MRSVRKRQRTLQVKIHNILKIRFLGTGTSQGIPVIGCDCEVCTSADPRDQRLRCSVLLQMGQPVSNNIIIDVGPDFRQQMLTAKQKELNAILLTHEHNDHIIGLDDIRPFNFRSKKALPVYSSEAVLTAVQQRFPYVFAANPYPGAPGILLEKIEEDQSFKIGETTIIPIQALHGKLPVLGFRVGDFTYLTDVKTIAKSEIEKIKGSRILVISALHQREHHSHLSLDEALELIVQIGIPQNYLTHLSHLMGKHEAVSEMLPPGVNIAWDGLEINC